MRILGCLILAGGLLASIIPPASAGVTGYYRHPDLHGDTFVFTAEGDLWTATLDDLMARRLTAHPEEEAHPHLSPDGTRVAYTASYDGSSAVYVMPLAGGEPRRLTYTPEGVRVVGWTPDGEVLFATRQTTTLPGRHLHRVDPATRAVSVYPLENADHGAVRSGSGELVFTRYRFQGSHTRQYQGGTAQTLWRWRDGWEEARPLPDDHPGAAYEPMWWGERVLFVTDRAGSPDLWSMEVNGDDLRRHTDHAGWSVRWPSRSGDRVLYTVGADLHLLDLRTGDTRRLPVTLLSDLDQRRERWVDEPMDYLTAAELSPDGDRVALTARGEVFVVPTDGGRIVEASRASGVRYRRARFAPDGDSLQVFSDASGEIELWTLPANGMDAGRQVTDDGKVLRYDHLASPDGRRIAHHDKDHELHVTDLETGETTLLARAEVGSFGHLAWSPDGRWLAAVVPDENWSSRIWLHDVEGGASRAVTSDRYDSYSPVFHPDGEWLFFLSDRTFQVLAGNVWGARQPEPVMEGATRLYGLALTADASWPFDPEDELDRERARAKARAEADAEADAEAGDDEAAADNGDDDAADDDAADHVGDDGTGDDPADDDGDGGDAEDADDATEVELDGLADRLRLVDAVPAGRYRNLAANADRLFWTATELGSNAGALRALAISADDPEPVTLATGLDGYALCADGSTLLLAWSSRLATLDAGAGEGASPDDLDLSRWRFRIDPAEEWEQMFVEAWRLERDYFYDTGLHGADWDAVLAKYRPLVPRITSRAELSDLLGLLIAELEALHMYVFGGDFRDGPEDVGVADLGAWLVRDEAAGGARVARVYAADPDEPETLGPLSRPGVEVGEGAVIEAVDGVRVLDAPSIGALLRDRVGRPVRLLVRDAGVDTTREVMVEPVSGWQGRQLRYRDWEVTRREHVETRGEGQIGYVHIRSMGTQSFSQWVRDFYPVFNRGGLIVDVRHNTGGNIESWLLSRLQRRPWMWWKGRRGHPYSNMQYAFDGHLVVLIDAFTASDGEIFAEGARRLGLGTVMGVRSWGGEIWLTYSNRLVDRGIASAAEFGVYGPEGEWLIEGHGVEPDVVVDNLPHATFEGGDAQLDAAIDHLLRRIEEEPVRVPDPPPYPTKARD